jgi:DNA-binding CsgD family transcriptional regulator
MAHIDLVGRRDECGQIDALLDRVRRGGGEALILHGDAGMGKSTLLHYAIAAAPDMTTVRTTGYESESEIPFAGLADLLRPLTDHVGALPEPQRAALLGVLALGPSTPAGRFTVCVATLGLLSAAAEQQPLLVVVDDAHWLDPSSAEAIRFTARRLTAEGIAVLVATRPTAEHDRALAGIPELRVNGLDFAPARELMVRHSHTVLDEDQARRLFTMTAGNPLALTQTPALLAAATSSSPGPLPAGATLERAFEQRIGDLPDDVRQALVVVAADQSSALAPITMALDQLGPGVAALQPAELARIVRVESDGVTFEHPLLRSVIYHRAPVAVRCSAHRALADAYARLDTDRAADARAWHLAAATLAPDGDVAAELYEAAVRARRRGAHVEAARGFERAAELAVDRHIRARVLTAAAKSWQLAGRVGLSGDLLAGALELTEDPVRRAEIQHLRGYVRMWREAPAGVSELLEREAARVEALDPDRATLMLADAAIPAFMLGEFDRALAAASRAHEVGRRAGPDARRVTDVQLAVARVTCGDRAGGAKLLESCREWLERESPLRRPQETIFAVITWMWLEDFATARRLIDRLIAESRGASALGVLPYALGLAADLDYRTGRWRAGIANAGESVQLADETHQANAYGLFFLGEIQAAMGQREAAEHNLRRADDHSQRYGIGCLPIYTGAARGLLALGLGAVDEAITHLERVAESAASRALRDPTVVPWAPDLVEALVRAGRPDDARDVIDTWLVPAADAGSTWAAACVARGHGLIAATPEAVAHFDRALRIHDELPCPFDRARTLLSFGEVLRRNRRRGDARAHLREALGIFEQLEAGPWIDRARSELRATGATARKRASSTAFELTPQELQIALMVADGATNQETASALFLSAKTVEYHLSKTYRKTGVSSRSELATLLADQPATGLSHR